ncbi:MAG: MBL fold metallo-hydrolase RNA specificity domain-containing protein [bacterium]
MGKNTKIRLIGTGHILGAVMMEIAFEWKGREYNFLYACDTRNRYTPLTPPWENVKRADWVAIESVYGNRDHGDFEVEFEKFNDLMNEAIMRGGTILIPAYSIDRTQKILYFLYKLRSEGKMRRRVDVYVDSRVANRITADHVDYWEYLGKPVQYLFRRRSNPFEFRGVRKGAPPENKRGSKIIIAPSAFCDEGTSIVKHVKRYVGDPNSVVIFTGFVLPESIGGQILAGKESVKIGGERYPIRCKSYRVSAFSGHADRNEIVRWFRGFEHVGVVLVVHGLPDGSAGLAKKLHDELGLKTYVPEYGESVDLMGLLEPTPTPAAAAQSAKP